MPVDFTSDQRNQNSIPALPNAVTPSQAVNEMDEAVKSLLVDYNKKFVKAAPAKYRDREVFQVVSQLMMSQKCCSLLVGAPGTGKTKIAEEVARLIAIGSPCVSALADYTVYELPLSNLMAGTQFRGQLEERVKALVEWLERNKVILFIDEIHQLTNGRQGYEGVSQALKPAMARGSIKMIGATTLQESKTLLEDPAFNRRFNRVPVCELSIEQTRDIIETVYFPKMSSHYSCGFAPGLAEYIVDAAEKSKTITCHRPDNAITLLDQVCANTVLQRNYNIATCTDPDVKQHMQAAAAVVNKSHVDNWSKDRALSVPPDFHSVRNKLLYRDGAIDALHKALWDYARFDAMFPSSKPFRIDVTGPACSGRTTLALECARLVDEAPVYMDLADYRDAPSLNRIIGSPLGYVGSDSKQEMPFDIVESNPRKLIVLDDFDEAHPVVKNFFDSAIATGLVKYADNRVIDISKCVVICVSKSVEQSRPIGFAGASVVTGDSAVRIEPLSASEVLDAAAETVRRMVAELKKAHMRYTSVPDDPGIPDSEKALLKGPADIEPAARRVLLGII